jgi:hypothetical protein
MEAMCSSETSVDFQRTTEDRTLHGSLMFRQVGRKGFGGKVLPASSGQKYSLEWRQKIPPKSMVTLTHLQDLP